MKTFLDFLLESKDKSFKKTIALVGGSFKFPTVAHWHMIELYANEADEVIVLISDPKNTKSIRKTSTGTIITALMAKDIFDIYISRYGLQNKVKAIVSPEPSPITAAFKYIDENLNDVNVIMGVSKKGGDESRFKSAEKYYADNLHINLIDPMSTAVDPYVDEDGQPISATDARDNLDNKQLIKKYLPKKLTDNDVNAILSILKVNDVKESENKENAISPLDETECIHIVLDDQLLRNAKILCYNASQTIVDRTGKEIPVNPKKFPTKAIAIRVLIDEIPILIYFDTHTRCWNSSFKYNGLHCCLNPDLFEQFFNTLFYLKLIAKLQKIWPLSDNFHKKLFDGIVNKQLWLSYDPNLEEASDEDDEDKEQPKFSSSGRKIMNFTDNGVSSEGAKFYCWPDLKKLDKWSTWKDWKKIKPLCRMRIKYKNDHEYTLTLSTVGEDYKNRGFRGIDITEQPPVQWLSKQEDEDFIKLSIVNKFIRHCIDKILKYVALDPEEIYSKINNPEKISVEEIRDTLNKIRNTLNKIIKKHKVDSFKWR